MAVRHLCGALVLMGIAAAGAAQQSSSFAGVWVLRVNGQNIFKLTLVTERGAVTGSLTKPTQLSIDQDGAITSIGPAQVTLAVQRAKVHGKEVELTIDDRFVMVLEDRDRATLALEGLRPWMVTRVPAGSTVMLASRMKTPDYPRAIRALRRRLRAMVKEEQEARLAFDEARIAAADAKNQPEVLGIFARYGWVTNSRAGRDAAHDFWLLVQHQTPAIQRRLLPALADAAQHGDASMSDYAYLYDRVQVGLGKPQRWGSQTSCQDGKPVLAAVEDPAGLDARRKELFMPPIAEYLKIDYLVKACSIRK